MNRPDMDLTGLPGMPSGAPTTPRPNNGPARGLPTHNPYARDKRVTLNREVYATLVQELKACVEELVVKGYKVSVADMLQAILHFGTPANADEAEALWQRWGFVKAAPPRPVDEEVS